MTSKEAFNDLKKRNEALKKEEHFHIGSQTMEVIQKLVERDTPMKPILTKSVFGFENITNCSKCKAFIDPSEYTSFNFCPICGQRLDWS